MTDEDTIQHAASIMGTKVTGPYGPYQGNKKPYWSTQTKGKKAVAWMMTLYSFMSTRRKTKIEENLQAWRAA